MKLADLEQKKKTSPQKQKLWANDMWQCEV